MSKEKDHKGSKLHVQQVSGSSIEGRKDKRIKYLSISATFLLVVGVVSAFALGGSAIIEYGNEFLAGEDVAEEVAAVEDEGFTFAFGTTASDETDFANFTIPEPSADVTEDFYAALETSPAFEEITSVEELLSYDQIDKNGTISQSAMEEIISIAEGAE